MEAIRIQKVVEKDGEILMRVTVQEGAASRNDFVDRD